MRLNVVCYKDARIGKFKDTFIVTPMTLDQIAETLRDAFLTLPVEKREPFMSVFHIGYFDNEVGSIEPINPKLILDYSSLVGVENA